jgi:ssDNA-binding Zn-finger/Zn-ribbon topoisomerase 1
VLRLRERAELLEAGSTHSPPVRRRRDPNEPCTICFAVVAEADAVFGSDVCSHVFHRACIEGWARECAERPHNVATRRGVRVSCPNCKKGTRVRAGPVESGNDGASDGGGGDGDESDASELMAEAPALGGATRSGRFGVGAQVEVVDDATVRGVIVDCRQSWKEVATTSGSIVLIRSPQLARATLTDEEAARCTRPISRKDYVQARIDGVIRFSHGGNDFRNCYTCADGAERRQFEVSETHVRCALCPEARWSLGTDCNELMRNFKRHCGQLSDGERSLAPPLHLERLVSAAGSPGTPVSPAAAFADEAVTVLGVSLAQARVLAEAAAAGRLIPVRAESSSAAPDL